MEYKFFNKKPEILIIDDSLEHIKFAAALLNGKYWVRAIIKGSKVYDALKAGIPDLILLDVLMPDINGFEICKALKADDRYSSVPIIFFTAVNDDENIIKGFQAGAQDYVSKPVNPNELLARIETHLSLKQRTDKLQEAYRDIESFNQIISHDLKSPIQSIQKLVGYLHDVLYTEDNTETVELLDMMAEKAQNAITLIEKYSELVKISHAQLSIDRIDLDSMLNELFEEIKTMNLKQKVVFKKSKLPAVYGDKLLLRQAIFNLLSNAMKFSSKNPLSLIEVDCKISGLEYVFSIKDNGAGFDMKYAENLFSFFVRLHSQEEYIGTGTGLSIVQKIISLHGGKTWICGEVDKGATAYFTLPIEVEI